jgi:hypothetical protein
MAKELYEQIAYRTSKTFHSDDGWRSRGYLLHFDKGGITQFVTFRLFDSLPYETFASLSN